MSNNYAHLTLDTTGPQSVAIELNGGAEYTANHIVQATISTVDVDTTGYSMKLWGDIDFDWAKVNGLVDETTPVQDVNEDNAMWIAFSDSKELRLTIGEGTRTVYVQLRDDVHNLSAVANDPIIVDTEIPNVLVLTGPTPPKISKVEGKNVSELVFKFSKDVVEYKVAVVGSIGDTESTSTVIGETYGSTNISGVGDFKSDANITCTITGTDLELASPGDGQKIIKVFAKDVMGRWSS